MNQMNKIKERINELHDKLDDVSYYKIPDCTEDDVRDLLLWILNRDLDEIGVKVDETIFSK